MLKNIKVVDSNIKNITLSADAHFINPNDVGGTLKTDNLKVFINDTEVAKFVSEEFKVPSKKDFKKDKRWQHSKRFYLKFFI